MVDLCWPNINHHLLNVSYLLVTSILPCKTEMQYLFTFQVSRYCLSALQSSIVAAILVKRVEEAVTAAAATTGTTTAATAAAPGNRLPTRKWLYVCVIYSCRLTFHLLWTNDTFGHETSALSSSIWHQVVPVYGWRQYATILSCKAKRQYLLTLK